MADISSPTTKVVDAPRRQRGQIMLFVTTQPMGSAGLIVIMIMMIAGIFAESVAPHDPVTMNYMAMLAPPTLEHPFGTDAYGRDVLSRIIYGARTALVIGLVSSFLGSSVGALIGVASAYFGGKTDMAIQRLIDILLSFPIIILAMVMVAILGRNLWLGIDINLVLAIAIPIIPKVARVTRSAALSIRELPYIDAARTAGFSHARIVLRHMLPNVMAPYLILLTAFIAQAILLEASLSFLGLGVTEPTPAWGLMLSGNNADFYREAPWLVLFPGLAISLAVFAFNLFGDSLRDFLDPKFKA
ncbi:ABC transporter permease [Aquibaculum arenosum]|uniref:ABC transporter permease n=1 Tax=Aquibaculum arenosum TaxID=3032591 RepID=A0ABT5YQT6_9PROT|nr:ABC transporter permease [Fodinicurvata sp. CAU 1616]MDF2097333.1 ABC transporter permease [Fodinicurvata sp. CAU 1616]